MSSEFCCMCMLSVEKKILKPQVTGNVTFGQQTLCGCNQDEIMVD